MSETNGALPTSGGYAGQSWFQTPGDDFGALDFLMRQVIAGNAWSGLVQVMAVHGGGVAAPATVDVKPLANQQDVLGNQVPHETVYGLPCFRYQSGAAACIIDPVIGAVGHAIICDRDISGIKASGGSSPPGSYRQHSWSDGIYYGGVLGGAPTDYVQIAVGGINIVSTGTINIAAAGGTTIDGKKFLPHTHTAPSGGGATSGVD